MSFPIRKKGGPGQHDSGNGSNSGQQQKLKSISVFVPLETVQSSLSEIGFLLQDSATVVAEGKFWKKMLYFRGDETISVSEEIGDAYPKDPIITICGSKNTISRVVTGVGGSYDDDGNDGSGGG